jgi:hypothetical protein
VIMKASDFEKIMERKEVIARYATEKGGFK